MRPSPLLLAAALLIALPAARSAADSGDVSPTAPAPSAESTTAQPSTESAAPAAADGLDPAAPPAAAVADEATSPVSPAATSDPTPTAPPETASDPTPSARAATAPASDAAPTPEPQVLTARIDPELALRLSLLEKAMLAQTQGQSTLYTETSRLLIFFGSACVGMGLIAMVAAVFLMNRTLASVSTITAQVTQPRTFHALPSAATAALVPAGPVAPAGFDKVQASGQRFQSRMTSLEQRLEELEHLAGHSGAAPVEAAADATEPEAAAELPPQRRPVPVSGILLRKAETLMNLNKLDDAMAALDEAANLDADPSEVHLARGRVLEKLGRLGDALQSYDLAVSNDEKNTAALLMKAGVLNRQERFDEALTCYERALAVHRMHAPSAA